MSAEFLQRSDERLAERVALHLAREISRQTRCLLPAVAEEQGLAALVRMTFIERFGRNLINELFPDEVRKWLFTLRRQIHDLERPASVRSARADRADT